MIFIIVIYIIYTNYIRLGFILSVDFKNFVKSYVKRVALILDVL